MRVCVCTRVCVCMYVCVFVCIWTCMMCEWDDYGENKDLLE